MLLRDAALLIVLLGISQSTQALSPGAALTVPEQSARLADFEQRHLFYSAPRTRGDPTAAIMEEVRRAQGGEPHYRRPVTWQQIDRLQRTLVRQTGLPLSRQGVAAMTDYVHAKMRESRSSSLVDLRLKLNRSLELDRKPFHGQVAEIAEARERGMVLTKDIRSQTYDLTEATLRPRSLQQKVTMNPFAGLRELQADLADAHPRQRFGVMPQVEISRLEKAGALVRKGRAGSDFVYSTTSGPRITVLPSRAFESTLGSQQYTQGGRNALLAIRPGSPAARMLARTIVVAGGLAAPLMYWESYRGARDAVLMFTDASAAGTALPYLRGAEAAGQAAAGTAFVWATGAQLNLFGLRNLQVLRMGAAGWLLPILAGAETLKLATASYEYSAGYIDLEAFRDRATGPALVLSFAAGGAAICSFIPTIGTMACATAGAVIALPVSILASWWRTARNEELDQERRHMLIEALEQKYRSLG